MQSRLAASGLTKRFGRFTGLEDVSFGLRDGEVLGLIGPNGAGKTTLFECLAGLMPLDGGTILVDGKPADHGIRAASSTCRTRLRRGRHNVCDGHSIT